MQLNLTRQREPNKYIYERYIGIWMDVRITFCMISENQNNNFHADGIETINTEYVRTR